MKRLMRLPMVLIAISFAGCSKKAENSPDLMASASTDPSGVWEISLPKDGNQDPRSGKVIVEKETLTHGSKTFFKARTEPADFLFKGGLEGISIGEKNSHNVPVVSWVRRIADGSLDLEFSQIIKTENDTLILGGDSEMTEQGRMKRIQQ